MARKAAPALPSLEEQYNELSIEMTALKAGGSYDNPRVRAWDSGLDNGELTIREGAKRYSDEHYMAVVSGFESMLNDNPA